MSSPYISLLKQLPDFGYCELQQYAVIRATGPDRQTYLQGQLTCDLNNIEPGMQLLGACCDPKGKMLAELRVLNLGEELLLLTQKSLLDKLLAELKKYAVFSKVTLEDASDQWSVLALAGPHLAGRFHSELPTEGSQLHQQGMELSFSQPVERKLFVLPKAQAQDMIKSLEADAFDESLWNGLEIAAGLAHLGAEQQLQFLPQSLNLQLLGGVSFKKGCYTGQEMVARARYRGANKRRVYLLTGTVGSLLTPESTLERKLESGWRSTGTILNHWQHQGEALMLAILPLDISDEDHFRIKDDENSEFRVSELPYSVEEQQ
ncbi:tRNA-modifying protein YgfZ [Dongshaea marina]|uniref:tRNA-modifying protein YgfZ n=1 Tax=Dongshaea marina TaxID=2047966 RepID=UPI00131F340F|nr:tRNA-modifying protein YgfZ [Dongshaea marina]